MYKKTAAVALVVWLLFHFSLRRGCETQQGREGERARPAVVWKGKKHYFPSSSLKVLLVFLYGSKPSHLSVYKSEHAWKVLLSIVLYSIPKLCNRG